MEPLGDIRFLSRRDVESLLPSVDRQIDLAAAAFRALTGDDIEMPPKVGVHPGPGEFLHAMPAWFRSSDVVGIKWVAGYPGNAAKGLLGVTGLIVVNDPDTGYPRCIMDGTLITLTRTVAVSGLALRLFRPSEASRIAVVGCGAQARAHLPVLVEGLSSVELAAYDRWPESAGGLVEAARLLDVVASAKAVTDVRSAVAGADLVFSAVSDRGSTDELITPDMVKPGALLLPIDWSGAVTAETAATASWFVVDDRAQFEYVRTGGGIENFDGYPDPDQTLGERLVGGEAPVASLSGPPPSGPVLVANLGIAAVDIMMADEVLRAAELEDAGTHLSW